MAEIGTRQNVEVNTSLLRHMIINSLRTYRLKFGREYGEMIIACDSKRNWRKQYFPFYKANRKKNREESIYDWQAIFDALNSIKEEIKSFLPYRVLEIEEAEADDIIASLVAWSSNNYLKENSLFSDCKPVLILSGDHDFIQLQKYKHVKQFAPVQKKFIQADTTPEFYLFEHIVRGDRGDGVPNVLSNDDSIVSGERQRPVSSKKVKEWAEGNTPSDETFRRNFDRNKKLIDLTQLPAHINDQIIDCFVNYPQKDKGNMLNYFINNKMKQLIEHLEDF